MLPFRCLFVCPTVTFVHCAQTAEDIDTISFAYDSPKSLPDRVKIWLTSVNLFVPKFWPKLTHTPKNNICILYDICISIFYAVYAMSCFIYLHQWNCHR